MWINIEWLIKLSMIFFLTSLRIVRLRFVQVGYLNYWRWKIEIRFDIINRSQLLSIISSVGKEAMISLHIFDCEYIHVEGFAFSWTLAELWLRGRHFSNNKFQRICRHFSERVTPDALSTKTTNIQLQCIH